jgi:cytochrome c
MKLNPLSLLLLLLAFASAVYAADSIPPNTSSMPMGAIERGEEKRATELLDHAVEYLQTNGPDNSFVIFNDRKGAFVDKEYYVYVVGLDGIMYASGGASNSLVGSNVLDLTDVSGIKLIRDMLDIAKASESGVIEYHWLNSVDNHLENKTTQFRKVGKYLVCVGYYIPRASLEEATVLLDRAVTLLKTSGGKIAFKAFNSPTGGYFVKDEYVFAIGLDGKYRASGAAPHLTGTDVRELTDAAGNPFFKEMIELAKLKGGGNIDYVWRNPATNAIENKHSLIQRVGDVLLGVGYYTKK